MDPRSLLEHASTNHAARLYAAGAPPGGASELSFPELVTRVRALAQELRELGLGARDVVAVVGPNSLEWLVADLALLAIGCVPCPIPEEAVAGGELATLSARFGLAACVAVHEPRAAAALTLTPLRSVPGCELARGPFGPAVAPPARDAFALTFSSGSAGTRKCLQLSWAGMLNTMTVAGEAWQLGARDNILLFLPLANLQQRGLCYLALRHGCTLTVSPPDGVFRAIKRHAPTVVIAPPSFYETVEKQCATGLRPEQFLGKSLRLMFIGSAPVNARTLEFYEQRGLPLFEVYGMNEFGWIAFNLPGDNVRGAAGKLVAGVRCLPSDTDEIVLHGAAPQSIGYYIDGVEDTASVYVAPNTIATNDLGQLRPDGRLYLVGRKKNLIITPGGVKIAPEPIEQRIESADSRIGKALLFLRDGAPMLDCMLWVSGELDATARHGLDVLARQLLGTLPGNERLGRVLLGDASELSHGRGLLTENGKPNRGGLLRAALAAEPV